MSQQITFEFNKATDDKTPQNQLHYTCYKSSEEINTLAKIDALGEFVADGTDVNTFTIPGLGELERVYFNVVVRDLAGRRRAYGGGDALTLGFDVELRFISENTFLTTGQSTQLVWIIDAQDGITDVTFSSNNEAVATVSASGVVTGVAEGTATITVTSVQDNLATDTLIIAVDTYDFTPLEDATIQTFETE